MLAPSLKGSLEGCPGRITSAELEGCLRSLEALAAGELRPILLPPAAIIRKQKNPYASRRNV